MKEKFIYLVFVFTVFFIFASFLQTFSAVPWQKQSDGTETDRPRCVLLEVFTSSSNAPCSAGNSNLGAVLAQNDDVGGKYTLIKYQMNFPGRGDPYYTEEGGVRKDFYDLFWIPMVYVDNVLNHLFMEFTHQALLDAQAIPAFCEIEAEYSIDGKTIAASAKIIPTVNFPDNIHLFMAIVEKVTHWNIVGSGEQVFFQVMKKFMPDENGIPLGNLTAFLPIEIDQTYTFKGEYRRPINADPDNIINHDIEHSVEDFNNLEVVVWLQNLETKEVLQSATAKLSNIPTLIKDPVISNVKLFPNPTTGELRIESGEFLDKPSGKAERKIKDIAIFDIFGRNVGSSRNDNKSSKIDISHLDSGIYFVNLIFDNDVVSVHKVVKK